MAFLAPCRLCMGVRQAKSGDEGFQVSGRGDLGRGSRVGASGVAFFLVLGLGCMVEI